jgi:hypothetical protein
LNNQLDTSIPTTDNSYTFDLNPNTAYTVKVDAIYTKLYENQHFISNRNSFITRGYPDNITIVNITSNSFTLYWDTLLSPPDTYRLVYTYNPTKDFYFSKDEVVPVSNTISSYTVTGLIKDIKYYDIRIASIYSDTNISYVTTNTSLAVATYSEPSFVVIQQTNTTIDISFSTPTNTTPDSYIITIINKTTNTRKDISFNSTNTYTIRDLSDNTSYDLIMSSYYKINNSV